MADGFARIRFLLVPAIATAAIACAGCATAPVSAADLALSRLSKTAAEWSDKTVFQLRYNPARCECPEFEALLGDVWHRVHIRNDSKQETDAGVLFESAAAAGPGFTTEIRGKISGITNKKFKSPVLRLEILSLCGSPGCWAE